MVTTRRQASAEKRASSTVDESDSDGSNSSIPATTSTTRRTRSSDGPTLRPKRALRENESPLKRKQQPNSDTRPPAKRQKRSTPIQPPPKPINTRRANEDDTIMARSALESVNAFRPAQPQSSRIEITLPTSAALQAKVRSRSRSTMEDQLLPTQGYRASHDQGEEDQNNSSNSAAIGSGRSTLNSGAQNANLYTIEESPQVVRSHGNVPATDTESPTRRRNVEDNADNGQLEELPDYESDDEELSGSQQREKTQYHTARAEGSPDLGSDELRGTNYDISEKTTIRATRYSSSARARSGPSRVPKVPFFNSQAAAPPASASIPVSEYIRQSQQGRLSHVEYSLPIPTLTGKVPNGLPRVPPIGSSQVPPPGAQPVRSSPPVQNQDEDVDMEDGGDSEDDLEGIIGSGEDAVEDLPVPRDGPARFFANEDDDDDLRVGAEEEEDAEEEEPAPAPARQKPAPRVAFAGRPRANGTFGTNGVPLSQLQQNADEDDEEEEREQPFRNHSSRRASTSGRGSAAATEGRRDRVSASRAKDSLPASAEDITTTVPSDRLKMMHELMGKPGWSELGKAWSEDLFRPDPFNEVDTGDEAEEDAGPVDPPTISQYGKLLFQALFKLKNMLSNAPSAPDWQGQKQYLSGSEESLAKYISGISKLVKRVCEQKLAVIDDSAQPSSNNLKRRENLVRDLVLCVVPLLVNTLWHAFSLGGVELNDDDGDTEGEFTSTTFEYLDHVTGWLDSLYKALMTELDDRPFHHNFIDGASEKERRAYPRKCEKKRAQLGKLLGQWNNQIQFAKSDLDRQVQREKNRLERLRLEPVVVAARKRAREEEEEETRRRYAMFDESLRRIAQENKKDAERRRQFFAARGHTGWTMTRREEEDDPDYEYEEEEEEDEEGEEFVSATEGGDAAGDEEEDPFATPGPGQLPPHLRARQLPASYRQGQGQGQTQRQPQQRAQPAPPPPPPQPTYTFWSSDEKRVLYREIRRVKPNERLATREDYESIADVLGKPMSEVLAEAAILRKAFRVAARERGVPIERWALEE